MSLSPYTPPKSDVAAAESQPLPCPSQVNIAVALLWIGWGLGLPIWYLSAVRDPATGFLPWMIAFTGTLFILSAALNVMVSRGRNWARIVVLVLVALSAIMILFPVDESSALEEVLTGLSVVLEGYAVYLLFTNPGKLWYQAR
jgi:hypothetical protein